MSRPNSQPAPAPSRSPLNIRAQIVQSELHAMASGSFVEATEYFAGHFTFRDNALDLDFTGKERLKEYFKGTRELFPDTTAEVLSLFECGERVVVELKLTATENVAYDGAKARRTGLTPYFVEWMEP